jgi:hypothetical protein
MTSADLAAQLPGGATLRADGKWWDGRCPAHEDDRSSLSFSDGNTSILLKCHAGCQHEAVRDALQLRAEDLRLTEGNGHGPAATAAVYDYRDATGELRHQTVRYADPKRFRQRRPDGLGGWTWSLENVALVLYRLPDLAEHARVYVVEGEKDADRLWSLGLPATCNPMGAKKWRAEYAAQLRAAGATEVVIFQDNDRAGVAHAEMVAASCHAEGLTVRRPLLPGLPPVLEKHGEDVSDWLDAGHSADELRRLVTEAPRWTPAAPKAGAANRWAAAVSAPAFLSTADPDADFLEARLLARGSVTEWFSPRGLGKTLVEHALLVKHAKLGRRVLLIDRDNPLREVKRRLRAWGAEQTPALKVLTRDNAPALTDRAAWASFPFTEFDLVAIDSIDSATEGVGENDSAKPAAALAPILDIAHREAGPAILLLGNVIKSGSHGRGSGVVEDRADIVYEVRDATNLQPTGSKPWWLELPAAGREAWGERAARRKTRDSYRLAFVPSKFRIGEEPDPFILEVDLTTDPWTLRDVTAEVEAAGQAAVETAEADRRQRLEVAARALVVKVAEAVAAGKPWTTTEAEVFLTREHDLKRKAARRLITDKTGALWRVTTDKTQRGHPALLFPAVTPEIGASGATGAQDIGGKSPPSDGLSYAVGSSSGRRETDPVIPAPGAVIQGGGSYAVLRTLPRMTTTARNLRRWRLAPRTPGRRCSS